MADSAKMKSLVELQQQQIALVQTMLDGDSPIVLHARVTELAGEFATARACIAQLRGELTAARARVAQLEAAVRDCLRTAAQAQGVLTTGKRAGSGEAPPPPPPADTPSPEPEQSGQKRRADDTPDAPAAKVMKTEPGDGGAVVGAGGVRTRIPKGVGRRISPKKAKKTPLAAAAAAARSKKDDTFAAAKATAAPAVGKK